jgi:hypothetical protein
LEDWNNGGRKHVQTHAQDAHYENRLSESYLERLWPLEEVLLSDKVSFVSCEARETEHLG